MSSPICFLTPFVTVARLKNGFISQDLQRAQSELCYLPTPCAFVVLQACYVTVAEPANTICPIINVATGLGTICVTRMGTSCVTSMGTSSSSATSIGASLRCSSVLFGFLPLLQNFLDLFPLYGIWELPEIKSLRNLLLRQALPYHVVNTQPLFILYIEVNLWVLSQISENIPAPLRGSNIHSRLIVFCSLIGHLKISIRSPW